MKFGATVVAEELHSVVFASSLHPPHRYLAANQRVWRGKKGEFTRSRDTSKQPNLESQLNDQQHSAVTANG